MHKAIITDLNKCVGCMACSVGCKAVNGVDISQQWIKIKRVGPYPIEGGSGQFPDVEMYFLPMQCQHCSNPECVTVCPTGASAIAEDGTVQIDAEQCIGCGMCLDACPYGVRYLDANNVAQKCNLCADQVADGGLPQCVTQCGGLARFYGDADGDVRDFMGAYDRTLGEFLDDGACEEFTDDQVYRLPDSGNGPAHMYILRNRTWRGEY